MPRITKAAQSLIQGVDTKGNMRTLMIGVINSKGGVGKSMLTANLSVLAAFDRGCAGIVDLDPQQTMRRWFDLRIEAKGNNADTDLVLFDGVSLPLNLPAALARKQCAVAFFDGMPGSIVQTEEAIKMVDFVVIPLKASDADISSTEDTISACVDFKTPYLLVINDCGPGVDKRALEVQDIFKESDLAVAETMVHRRVGYTDAANDGLSISELKNQRAGTIEIRNLYDEVVAAADYAVSKAPRLRRFSLKGGAS